MVRGEPHSVLDGQPLRHLSCRPTPLTGFNLVLEGRDQRGSEPRGLSHVGLIWQRLEAAGQELLDPEAHPLLTDPQVEGNLGDAPAGVRQAHHL
jgi:hypothetical protein